MLKRTLAGHANACVKQQGARTPCMRNQAETQSPSGMQGALWTRQNQ